MKKVGRRRLFGIGWVIIVLAVSAYGLSRADSTPQSTSGTFWGALTGAMTTDGITCSIHDNTAGRGSTQIVSLDLAGKTNATSTTTITQNGSTVQTEGVATVSDDYVRYANITSKAKGADGKPLDFSKIVNVWGKQARGSNASLFEQTALGGCVVPLARLTDKQAADMVLDMQKNNVFQADVSHPKKATDNGVVMLRYAVRLQPASYVAFMKRFAGVDGLQSLNTLSTTTFNGAQARTIDIDINPSNDRISQISYSGQNHTITLTNYGKRPDIHIPQHTIAMTGLEQRLQSIK